MLTSASKPQPLSAEEQNQLHYRALLDSVTTVNHAIDHQAATLSPEILRLILKSNLDHMEAMLAKTIWTDQDMTTVTAAVERVKNYLG